MIDDNWIVEVSQRRWLSIPGEYFRKRGTGILDDKWRWWPFFYD